MFQKHYWKSLTLKQPLHTCDVTAHVTRDKAFSSVTEFLCQSMTCKTVYEMYI